jgi:hypothetical protein
MWSVARESLINEIRQVVERSEIDKPVGGSLSEDEEKELARFRGAAAWRLLRHSQRLTCPGWLVSGCCAARVSH